MGSCITERVKRLAGNEIELGMEISTIEYQASNISPDKGNGIRLFQSSTMWFKPIKIFVEYVGVITGIQVPLLIIDRRGVSVMSACSRTRRVTHLTFGNATVVLGY